VKLPGKEWFFPAALMLIIILGFVAAWFGPRVFFGVPSP
jgi:hypothetical protein